MKNIDKMCVDNLRYLSATAISNAKSGHTGVSVGASAIFYALYKSGLKFYSDVPNYFNRDRFTMCAGHASALLYSTLHMFGFDYSIQDLKHFRKLGSKTKGHPSVNPCLGIDATGGPLGQGLPMAVGMAIAEKKLASKFNREGFDIINHHTFCFVGDGSLMEGVTAEASSLAGTLKLNKLVVLYDSNHTTIEGDTNLTFNEDVLLRYKAYGWNTIEVKNGNDVDEIVRAIDRAKQEKEKPTIIKIDTTIGYKTFLEGNCKIHGTPLTPEQLVDFKHNLGIDYGEFVVADEVREHIKTILDNKKRVYEGEQKVLQSYKEQYPFEYAELNKWLDDYYSKNLNWDAILGDGTDEATRVSSKKILTRLAELVPNLISGSADLSSSIGTKIDGGNFSAENIDGRNICFGVREHAMASICNGIALHGGYRVVCSTFMVFSDYMRHAIRMSALMGANVIYLLSHDSIAVGEDGATHQPVEYNAMYRATPNLNFIRPADFNETKGAYKIAIGSENVPTIICLTRQATQNLNNYTREDIGCGAYEVVRSNSPDCIIMSSGSELGICIEASNLLKDEGYSVRVISVPCTELFDKMDDEYKDLLLPNRVRTRIFVEASNDDGLYKYVGLDGQVKGIKSFGHTGSGVELLKEFGFTADGIKNSVKSLINKNRMR